MMHRNGGWEATATASGIGHRMSIGRGSFFNLLPSDSVIVADPVTTAQASWRVQREKAPPATPPLKLVVYPTIRLR